MALFVDGAPSSVEDLTNQDSGLLEVCRTEGIDVAVKLRFAHEELSSEMAILFEMQRTVYTPYYGERRLRVDHVVVTELLKVWHTYTALALVYRDAYFTQLNDRFQAKWNEFRSLAQSAKNRLQLVGVGIVLDPLSRPTGPTIALVPATETGGTFYFSVATTNAAGEESSASITGSLELPNGNALSLQLGRTPRSVTGWNAYVGESPASMFRQNESPLAVEDSWVFFPSTAQHCAPGPGEGQKPNFLRSLPKLIQRG